MSNLVANGRRIESQSEFFAVLVRRTYLPYLDRRELVSVDDSGSISVKPLSLTAAQLFAFAGIVVVAVLIVIAWVTS